MRARFLMALSALAGCTAAAAPETVPPPVDENAPHTVVFDRAEADRLLGASGVTLQWIDWNQRGSVFVREEGGMIRLTGAQAEPNGPGRLFLDGEVREIGTGYFLFEGVIRITDTPDSGRRCEADKLWHFAVTQNRPYWRLREFEWCDYLTDYVDIYMPGTQQ